MEPKTSWCRRLCRLGVIALLLLGGCHRSYYRRQADQDAANLIQEKANSPHWALPRQSIDVDPRSRMFDPFNPDFEPMPYDDPYSHELMHFVDGKKGWRKWHKFGDSASAENPTWRDFLPVDENGVLLLNAELAYQLALLHSRDYQQQYETLYLSALDVSAERFRFDTQFFGGYAANYTTTGQNRAPRSRLELDTLTLQQSRLPLPTGTTAPTDANLLWRRGFATGAELAVGIANTLTWDLAGPNDQSSLTILDFGMIQPLLRLAGRERVLEQLTLSERLLLANVRQMERYRGAFYAEILTGRDAGNGATRRGGVFGGAGLEGFSGVGGGGFGGVGNFGFGTGTGTQLTAPRSGGFLGLLQSQQDIRIQQANIAGLRSNLAQLRESYRENLTKIPDDPEALVRDRLQIAQARQALLNSETNLLSAQTAYQQTLDQFKITMGLPPAVCIALNDPKLDEFNLIDPSIVPLQNEITSLREQIGFINDQLLGAITTVDANGQPVNTLQWDAEVERNLTQLRSRLSNIRRVRQQLIESQLIRAQQDLAVLQRALPDRQRELERLRRKYFENREKWDLYRDLDPCQVKLNADVDPTVFDSKRLDAVPTELEKDLELLVQRLEALKMPLDEADALLEELLRNPNKPAPAELYRQLEGQVIFRIPGLLSELSGDVLDLSLIQARARVDAVELTPIDITWDFAVELARRYRHDWMNARATLVDAWRLIYFNADALQSTLDLTFNGDIRNVGDNPLDLSGRQSRLRVGLRWDGPWTRLRERNTYRQALIEFQQSRRRYYAYEDAVAASLRDTIRTIDLNQVNFEQRRVAVLSAIEQVVLNNEIQKFRDERGLVSGPTAARDAVSALTDLQQAQNVFLGIWVNYEALRILLDLDLGTMQLDGDGNWVDPGPMGPGYGLRLPEWDSDGPQLFFEPTLQNPGGDTERGGEPVTPGPAVAVPEVDGQARRLPALEPAGSTPSGMILPTTFIQPFTPPPGPGIPDLPGSAQRLPGVLDIPFRPGKRSGVSLIPSEPRRLPPSNSLLPRP